MDYDDRDVFIDDDVDDDSDIHNYERDCLVLCLVSFIYLNRILLKRS